MDRTHGPLHLNKLSFLHWKIMDISTTSIWIIIFFDGSFEYDVMSGQKLNFGQCHIFVSYLSSYFKCV
jgi:hypothetical protein